MHDILQRLVTDIGQTSITNLSARIVLVALIIFCVLFAAKAIVHHHLRHWVILTFALSIVVGFLSWAILEVWWVPFTDHMPFWLYCWIAAMAFVIFSAVVQKGRRILLSIVALVGVVTMLGSLNFLYNQYPDFDALANENVDGYMTFKDFSRMTEAPTNSSGQQVGQVFEMPIGSQKSDFSHRHALVYVPPAYFSHPDFGFPVFVMMHGNPGGPTMWFGGGTIDKTMDSFAAAHNGFAPIIVAIDATGSMLANPICMDTRKGKTMTYIAEDVPDSIKSTLHVDSDQSHWVIGGLSYGGTCSLQVATNHPEAYGTFLDLSGQIEPTIGNHKQTVRTFFNGNDDAFRAQNPQDLLEAAAGTDKYKGIAGRFVAGSSDKDSVSALTTLNDLAQKAGMDTELQIVSGAHDWNTWRAGFNDNLEFLIDRTQLLQKIGETK
ncbi:MAG: alpha/beta hydrolase-fold protein [Corynebacterium sp.]|nr:alpha/beta hydrolase-fold protein [Corynebacterium sp.]